MCVCLCVRTHVYVRHAVYISTLSPLLLNSEDLVIFIILFFPFWLASCFCSLWFLNDGWHVKKPQRTITTLTGLTEACHLLFF